MATCIQNGVDKWLYRFGECDVTLCLCSFFTYAFECKKVSRLLNREVVVQGNPKVYKALRNALGTVLFELRRIENGEKIDEDLLTLIDQIANILNEMKG